MAIPNFLTMNPGTANPAGAPDPVFGAAAVAWAQQQLWEIFEGAGIDVSSIDPAESLATHLRLAAGQSATYLINLAITLCRLRERTTIGSQDLFWNKVRLLFRRTSNTAYEELLVELEVGSEISIICSPIEFEVMVPKSVQKVSSKPPSPDYAIAYRDTRILVEATVWHWEAVAAWARLQEVIHETLKKRLHDNFNIQRRIRLELPINANPRARDDITSREVCMRIAESDSGDAEFDVGCESPARMTWEPVLWGGDVPDEIRDVIQLISGADPGPAGEDAAKNIAWTPSGAVGGTGEGGSIFAWAVNPCFTEQSLEEAIVSIRNSINRKKKQASGQHPFLLALSLNNSWANWDVLSPILNTRLWPNAKYKWLSGIIEYRPDRFRFKGPYEVAFRVNANPYAELPVPADFLLGRMWHVPRTP
ncbi:hypothetical protein [Mycobacterium sp. 1423905.2]|uniref:hypothetical protein n=1 Tax=Mycobacterium sp. 1423905.2 TaxID=1856859 RepID=UPI0012E9D325|nr:hypothetical protein [Mycobacterium sp. 1423905.2]